MVTKDKQRIRACVQLRREDVLLQKGLVRCGKQVLLCNWVQYVLLSAVVCYSLLFSGVLCISMAYCKSAGPSPNQVCM